jgi:hypothetical protein
MKNIITYTIICMVLLGCKYSVPEKPYIITKKLINYSKAKGCNFTLISKDGKELLLQEPCINYTIGDTIK